MRHGIVILSGLALVIGCSDDSRLTADLGQRDGASRDAGSPDSSAGDSMTPDRTPPLLDLSLPDGDGPVVPACLDATGAGSEIEGAIGDSSGSATVSRAGIGCLLTYTLSSSAPLRDSLPTNPRQVAEHADWPTVRSRNTMFDALYALALAETRENSVSEIRDGSFNDGQPIPCPAGGCFETGRKWKYVWTRDTSYAVDLGLAALDPIRALNSLSFKTSERREGGGREIMQDTGTGGSYPISSDRVVWAIGARRLLHFLTAADKASFASLALQALRNTAEHDRQVVYDPTDGLYRGEQSFLDWREQSYPLWVKDNPIHIGLSKALSTNVGHYVLLHTLSELARAAGDSNAASRYGGWAAALATAIDNRLYQADSKLYATFIPTFFDTAANHHYDLLGSALAIIEGIASDQRARDIVAHYPHLENGAPVIWPQQQQVPIYHNRAIWPFVSAYWLRAAAKTRNDSAVNLAVRSLMRGAALNLSNMENFELVTGKPWRDDGDLSGPVINSQRQLWSVAAYISLVHDVIFGLQTTDDAIDFRPYITRELRGDLFAATDTLVLNNLRYRGKTITVIVKLPAATADKSGAYQVGNRTLNGNPLAPTGLIPASALRDRNLLEIELLDVSEAGSSITLIRNSTDPKALFGPKPPAITAVGLDGGKLKIDFDPNGEVAADISFNVYRDGQPIATGLSGSDRAYVDSQSSASSPSHCYVVESYYKSSHNHSHHSEPVCFWGASFERVTAIGADQLNHSGGQGSTNHGRFHYEPWGDPADTLELTGFTPSQSGRYLLQVSYGNGSGSTESGITCAVKKVEVFDGSSSVGSGQLVMPELGSWDTWRDSSLVPVTLSAGTAYRIVIGDSSVSYNMSVFDHFSSYNGEGGKGGAFNRVNIAELKLLYVGP